MFHVTPDHYLFVNVMKAQVRPTHSRRQACGQLILNSFRQSTFNATKMDITNLNLNFKVFRVRNLYQWQK